MKNKRKYLIIFIALSCLSIVFSYGISFAKYVSNSLWNYYLDSKEFYLESDELKVDGKTNVNKLWNGESVHFSLKNSTNKSLVTDYDISYQATCTVKNSTSNVRCVLNGTDSDTYDGILSSYAMCVNQTDDNVDVSAYNRSECETNSYSWTKKIADKDMYFDVIGAKEGEAVVVDIKVVSTSPYKKTLTGEFNLKRGYNSNGNITTQYNHYTDYDELVVSNSSEETKCLSIKWDSPSLRIDYDKDLIKDYEKAEAGYINSIDITIEKQDSVSYRFYKTDSKEYSLADFSLIENEAC